MYSHEDYLKNRTSIRNAQKKYYDKNKSKICSKYAHIRRAWDNKNRAYLNEHARLNKQIKNLKNEVYTPKIGRKILTALTNKQYLSELHSRGLI